MGQLLAADLSNPPHESLLVAYETAKRESRNATPPEEFFTRTCSKFSRLYGTVVAIFDAFDECEPSEQGEICNFIENFNSCDIRTYVTTRSHSDRLFLSENLAPDTAYIEITARDDDVKTFLLHKLRRRKIKLPPEIESDLVVQISNGLEGM